MEGLSRDLQLTWNGYKTFSASNFFLDKNSPLATVLHLFLSSFERFAAVLLVATRPLEATLGYMVQMTQFQSTPGGTKWLAGWRPKVSVSLDEAGATAGVRCG